MLCFQKDTKNYNIIVSVSQRLVNEPATAIFALPLANKHLEKKVLAQNALAKSLKTSPTPFYCHR